MSDGRLNANNNKLLDGMRCHLAGTLNVWSQITSYSTGPLVCWLCPH